MTKLTPTQMKVMGYLLPYGRTAKQLMGKAVYVSGVRVCYTPTMGVLKRMGLVRSVDLRSWEATEEGRNWK